MKVEIGVDCILRAPKRVSDKLGANLTAWSGKLVRKVAQVSMDVSLTTLAHIFIPSSYISFIHFYSMESFFGYLNNILLLNNISRSVLY